MSDDHLTVLSSLKASLRPAENDLSTPTLLHPNPLLPLLVKPVLIELRPT